MDRTLSESAVWLSLAGSPSGAPDHDEEGLEAVHEPSQGPHPGPMSVCLLPDAQVAVTTPRSLDIWCW